MDNKKKINERLDYNVSTCVSFDLKNKLYRIANDANTTVSEVVRRILEKAIAEYMED